MMSVVNITIYLNNLSTDYTTTEISNELRWTMLLLTMFVFCGILGNLLVCLAIATEKKLQNVTNYFLLSLAVADLLVSVLVMPMSIINEMYGYWPLGHVLCNSWLLTDVLLCTSSIIHMSVISFDRYIGIRSPLKTRNKSMKVVGLKIGFVWILSFLISSPLLGLGMADEKNVLDNGICAIHNGYFMLYGSVSAFFIPLIMMTIMYSLTVDLLKKQAEQCKNNGGGGGELMRRSTSSRKRRKKEQNGDVDKPVDPTEHEQEPLIDRENSSKRAPKLGTQTSASSTGSIDTQVPRLRGLVMKHSMKIKAATMMLQRRDAMERRERENTVKTEQKAAKVLGIMFGLFVICWGPFFSVNVAIPLCEICEFDDHLLTVFLWLGYISSIVNPVVYTAFNRVFRQAFIRLLLCKYREQCLNRSNKCCLSSRKTQPYTSETNVSNKPRVSHDSRSDDRRDSNSSQTKAKLVENSNQPKKTESTIIVTSENSKILPMTSAADKLCVVSSVRGKLLTSDHKNVAIVTSSSPTSCNNRPSKLKSLSQLIPKRECDIVESSGEFSVIPDGVSNNESTLVPNPLTRSRTSLRETSC